ncbi:MAG: hypothetical protein LUD48_01415 [Prevotella sp.]|nr:hypothetical protein [Prevotella sp.]
MIHRDLSNPHSMTTQHDPTIWSYNALKRIYVKSKRCFAQTGSDTSRQAHSHVQACRYTGT